MLKLKKVSVVALAVSAIMLSACNEKDTAKAPAAVDINADQYSYAVGVAMGKDVQQMLNTSEEMKYDSKLVVAGIQDVLNNQAKLTDEQVQTKLESMMKDLGAKAQQKAEKMSKEAKAEGDKFRADFAKQEGVKTTASGLLYKIEQAGEGASPKADDVVKVHYTGKLVDGTVFDSSVERGQPAEFKLNQVVPGWTEGLQLLKKGGKIQLVLPPELAYGEQGAGGSIPPNSTLIFDVELLDINPAK